MEAESELDSGWEALAQAEAELFAQEQVLSDGEAQLNAGSMELAGQEREVKSERSGALFGQGTAASGRGKTGGCRRRSPRKNS